MNKSACMAPLSYAILMPLPRHVEGNIGDKQNFSIVAPEEYHRYSMVRASSIIHEEVSLVVKLSADPRDRYERLTALGITSPEALSHRGSQIPYIHSQAIGLTTRAKYMSNISTGLIRVNIVQDSEVGPNSDSRCRRSRFGARYGHKQLFYDAVKFIRSLLFTFSTPPNKPLVVCLNTIMSFHRRFICLADCVKGKKNKGRPVAPHRSDRGGL
ncbi:hypothetical protein B0H67DRAFT_66592 [Lasiosphaeris hirsuta]|uniref:Uncharacterized protein n=1 Tax=Lasiosphaeris hirsuta TaxID=260670 RepID=A0AA40E7M4_9PEZI|nr:hypothetical protein B0H67DRAFT_66592 [Lasiosphaeris hirsuta]